MGHPFLLDIFAAVLLFFFTLGGGILPSFYLGKVRTQILISFGGSYLFSTILLHNIPELFSSLHGHSSYIVGVFLLLGFYFQLLLDFISMGIAHNHTPHYPQSQRKKNSISPILLFLSLSLHALLEGIFIATHTHHGAHHHLDFLLFASIILHKIPASFSLSAALEEQSIISLRKKIMLLSFALATPLSWIITLYFQKSEFSLNYYLIPISSIATGSMLHISATILFESGPEHNISPKKWLSILIGSFAAFIPALMH